jgi:metal-responsive CopG/Arc/MetJ family transcriptional regulator
MDYNQKKQRTITAYPPEPLITKMDEAVERTGSTRSAVVTEAIREKLERMNNAQASVNKVSRILS